MSSTNKFAFWTKQIIKNILFSVPVTVTFLDTFGYIAKVEGISMQPSLNPDDHKTNDYVLLNKFSLRNYEVNHGDIVALTCPCDPDQKIIKRVIATEGETIKCIKKGVYIYVPRGHCWVEGDHVANSMDSNRFGPVSLGLIFAKASHIVWPPARWQKLDSQLPEGRHPASWPRLSEDSWNADDDDDDED